MKMIHCQECIESLRIKLFSIKTKYCMESYYSIKKFILSNNLTDLYSGSEVNPNNTNYNIEHAIPVTIFKGRSTSEAAYFNLFVNREPFADPHILFPTLKSINILRSNYVYGKLANDRASAVHNNFINKISNNGKIYDKREFEQIKDNQLKGTEQEDIYVHAEEYCLLGKCIFQPNKKFDGDIARIVFYFYLMYGYNPQVRPYTNDNPWLYDSKCNFFDYKAWFTFFDQHLAEYYKWAQKPIAASEHNKNTLIINTYALPNIFIGCCTEDETYITFPNIIDDLFFGRPHDHNIYKLFNFWNPYEKAPDFDIIKELFC